MTRFKKENALCLAVTLTALVAFSCLTDPELPPLPEDHHERSEALAEVIAQLAILEDAGVEKAQAMLEHEDHRVRFGAARRIGVLPEEAGVAIPGLLKVLKDEEPKVIIEAASTLGKIKDERAIEPLIKNMAHENRKVRLWCWKAIREFGNPAIPYLLSHLKKTSRLSKLFFRDEAGNKRSLQVELKARMSSFGKEIVPFLAEALEDEDPWLPANAARILGRIGPKAKGVIMDLIKALENIENDKLRQYAARALGKIGDLEPQVVPALTKATTDPKSEVANEARKALKTIRDSEKKKKSKKKKKKRKKK